MARFSDTLDARAALATPGGAAGGSCGTGNGFDLPDWRALARLSDGELAGYDIAAVNLAAARGLPGWETVNVRACLDALDAWAERVRVDTDRALARFHRTPWEFENSEGYFRTLVMVTVLQRDLGLRYNPEKVAPDAPFDTADAFIHGAVLGPGGTCATLPLVYAAVGRRLGHPIKIVSAFAGSGAAHQFARWDGAGGDRFNIEASARGLRCPPDDYYRTGRYAVTPEVERLGGYLRSKTPREELAGFLAERAVIWAEAGERERSAEGFAWASALAPDNHLFRNSLSRARA